MPSKNAIKTYVAGGIYHIYNRGHNKNVIFRSPVDYQYFMRILKESLTPIDILKEEYRAKGEYDKNFINKLYRLADVKNHAGAIRLLAFCLMPNHYHLLVQQHEKRSIVHFIRSIQTRYSMFHNRKYKRLGTVLQGRYKAVYARNERYVVFVSKYIHLNPSDSQYDQHARSYPWSSLGVYMGDRYISWISKAYLERLYKDSPFCGSSNRVSKQNEAKTYKEFVVKGNSEGQSS